MNTKIIGSIVRWALIILGAVGTFASDASFMDALNRFMQSISSGDVPTIIGSLVALATLGWSIWDKVKTSRTETALKAEIQSIKMASIEAQSRN